MSIILDMGRPFPVHPRGQRRALPRRERGLLVIPRMSPRWELGAIAVLMKPKPHLKEAIQYAPAEQALPVDAITRVEEAFAFARERFDFKGTLHLPAAGDYVAAIEFTIHQLEAARALAVLLSKRLPGVWLKIERLFVRDGTFYRRQYGYKLKLVEATNVHLPMALRRKVRTF